MSNLFTEMHMVNAFGRGTVAADKAIPSCAAEKLAVFSVRSASKTRITRQSSGRVRNRIISSQFPY
jgi:hypothetical protein